MGDVDPVPHALFAREVQGGVYLEHLLSQSHDLCGDVLSVQPLNRLQHVDLQRGPLERMYGLASLVLYTAGTSSASISIPGLAAAEAERLRDHLVAIGGDDAV